MSLQPPEKQPAEVTADEKEANCEHLPGDINRSAERKLLRKIDFHLIMPLWIVFVFGFLDRINLGNVAVLGILKELHLKGNDFNIPMQIFFVPYILLKFPSNLILKNVGPQPQFVAWLSSGVCNNFRSVEDGLVSFFFHIFQHY